MNVFQDWVYNKNNIRFQFILVIFRTCAIAANNRFYFILFLPILIFYRVVIEWIIGVEIPYKTKIGRGLQVFHGIGLVINDGSIIGDFCIVRHCTTIGNKQLVDGTYSNCPIIGDYVDIGANVSIIGPIKIGNNVKIGAGSVVVKDVPNNCIIAGNPARIIKYLK